LAAAVPVIAFETGGISEVIENGATCISTESVDEMASEAVALLNCDPERCLSVACVARGAHDDLPVALD
jgi:hypothetical protein